MSDKDRRKPKKLVDLSAALFPKKILGDGCKRLVILNKEILRISRFLLEIPSFVLESKFWIQFLVWDST